MARKVKNFVSIINTQKNLQDKENRIKIMKYGSDPHRGSSIWIGLYLCFYTLGNKKMELLTKILVHAKRFSFK